MPTSAYISKSKQEHLDSSKENGTVEIVRFITATSLFDGHDASINIIRRMLQKQGAEVIHLGHNRSVQEVVDAALQEDAKGIAISSYQGGHVEYFKYMIDLLKENNASHIKVFGGGGGVIVADEIDELQRYGVAKIYSPEDGRQIGLEGMAEDMINMCRQEKAIRPQYSSLLELLDAIKNYYNISQLISEIENPHLKVENKNQQILKELFAKDYSIPVIGFTGTGGAGKSSLLDEFIRRFLFAFSDIKIAVVSIDPTQRKTGGALLGDRLRMNSAVNERVFMHSLATRNDHASVSGSLSAVLQLLKAANFTLILVESAGIGQSDTMLADLVDFSVYVMTSEFGAETQLEKISMLDYADFIILNKYDKEKSADALKAIRKQYRRNHNLFDLSNEELPISATRANQFNDEMTNVAFLKLIEVVKQKIDLKLPIEQISFPKQVVENVIVPANRKRYLAEIADVIRDYKNNTISISENCQKIESFALVLKELSISITSNYERIDIESSDVVVIELIKKYNDCIDLIESIDKQFIIHLKNYQQKCKSLQQPKYEYTVRDKKVLVDASTESLSQIDIPKVAVPNISSLADIATFLRNENFPGEFPFTAGVFPFKRTGEDPTRMFAGEGNPERTNRRFHFICQGQAAARLSTAFDSITLYGENPDVRPDIYGKIGNAGVSICTVDDIKKLYSGFNLAESTTSVSMTINGPAPVILAFYFNAAIDQQIEIQLKKQNKWADVSSQIQAYFKAKGFEPPNYSLPLPEGNDGLGLGFIGVSAQDFVEKSLYEEIKEQTLQSVRGTVQADILKEDQAQNTCIYSSEFSLKVMGDIQEYFVAHEVKNFYSVSISGYHIAEAGANPITQVAFTLANGFTYLEYYLSRGLNIDKFARNMSFFFSNGMDPEYAVIGRVARRIWAIALKNKYKASERSQKLKYHIQTSGRSLHAQEISFNDIRTTLQALYAIADNCNSLHTNAYDEAITTPTPESVRRAIAIQMIINKELGLTKNENPLQGSYFTHTMTELVEDAILTEFDRITERGGVLGAMETMYQRHKIQEESMFYEQKKQDGSFPIIGVNTWLAENEEEDLPELMRSTEEEKQLQLRNLKRFHKIHDSKREAALNKLKEVALAGQNVFEELLETVKHCSLGQISAALYQVGGSYRRSM